MANRTLSHPDDKTVTILIKLPTSLKLAVEDLSKKTGKSMSELFRGWAAAQVDSHEVELIQLDQEEINKEAELNIIRAQKSQLKAELNKQLVAGQTREQLLDQAAERLLKGARVIDFKDRDFVRISKTNIEDMNRILGGSGEPITNEDLNTVTLKKAGARGVRIL